MTKETIHIKKYGNRRLYDMAHKCYITLEELKELIRGGYEVQISDSKTGEDITPLVLTQLILEGEKTSPNGLFTSEFLHQLIQYHDQSLTEFFKDYLPRIFQSYVGWQQEAHSQFLKWAQLGWSNGAYSTDLWRMPGLAMWPWAETPPPTPQESPSPETPAPSWEEMEALRQKIEALENRLNKSRKRG